MRERGGRTLPYVFKSEDGSIASIKAHVAPGSTIHADEATHWDALQAKYLTKRINHSAVYSDGDACTNQAESFFSRTRRAERSAFITISRVRIWKLMRMRWLGGKTIAGSAMANNI